MSIRTMVRPGGDFNVSWLIDPAWEPVGQTIYISLWRACVLPWPLYGDRVQLSGPRHSRGSKVPLILSDTWATVVALSPRRYLIVEPDEAPGERYADTQDVLQYRYCGVRPVLERGLRTSEQVRQSAPEIWHERQIRFIKRRRQLQNARKRV